MLPGSGRQVRYCCSNLRNAINVPDCKGKTGNVCPDDEGKYDPCCKSQCRLNPGCAALKLTGFCCPTPGAVQLGCCSPATANTTLLQLSEPAEFTAVQGASSLVAFAVAGGVVAGLAAVGVAKFYTRAATPEGYSQLLVN